MLKLVKVEVEGTRDREHKLEVGELLQEEVGVILQQEGLIQDLEGDGTILPTSL